PQWVKVHQALELLDTPGILPPVCFDSAVALKLALVNLLPEGTYNVEDTAQAGLTLLGQCYPQMLKQYGLSQDLPTLDKLAIAKNCLMSGGRPDRKRAAQLFLRDLRQGTLGKFVLD
ncbi:MAG: ribosome biogenesis GTPase YlqF, partial [Candidatus Melainabacteria bacterium]|nr:ribosome biogenesis GTPase YlqF [Candidatus Melainabacteria bacterium]